MSHQTLKSNGWSHTTNTKSNKEEAATSLDCKEIEFPISKKAIIKLKDKIITTLILSKVYPIYLSKNLKIIKNYCCWRKKINHTMFTLKILIELCIIQQNTEKLFIDRLFPML